MATDRPSAPGSRRSRAGRPTSSYRSIRPAGETSADNDLFWYLEGHDAYDRGGDCDGAGVAVAVAVDTVYAAAGSKPVLFRLLLETAISGTDEVVPDRERDYVQQMRAEPRARRKLEIYAGAVRAISERLGPLHLMLRDAAARAPELARIRNDIASRRAANMGLLAADLTATGDLRSDLTADEIADVIWTMNSAEFHHLLVHERGWSPEAFERWLSDCWCRLILDDAVAN